MKDFSYSNMMIPVFVHYCSMKGEIMFQNKKYILIDLYQNFNVEKQKQETEAKGLIIRGKDEGKRNMGRVSKALLSLSFCDNYHLF